MVDPRYDNVEVYHSTEWGLVLKGILASSEVLAEALIPEFSNRCRRIVLPCSKKLVKSAFFRLNEIRIKLSN